MALSLRIVEKEGQSFFVLDVEKKKGPGYRWAQSNATWFLPKGESKFREEVTERETQERYSDATGIMEPRYC